MLHVHSCMYFRPLVFVVFTLTAQAYDPLFVLRTCGSCILTLFRPGLF